MGDDENPGKLVEGAVEHCLALARTWHGWDGRPIARFDDDVDGEGADGLLGSAPLGSAPLGASRRGAPGTWTPYKALRRITDHLVDHLHEVEALLAGAEPIPGTWHGRMVTFDADWARFTEVDYDEACSRLRRLGRLYVLRYAAAGPPSWDAPRDPAWTLRQIAEHVSEVTWYADQIGRLA